MTSEFHREIDAECVICACDSLYLDFRTDWLRVRVHAASVDAAVAADSDASAPESRRRRPRSHRAQVVVDDDETSRRGRTTADGTEAVAVEEVEPSRTAGSTPSSTAPSEDRFR